MNWLDGSQVYYILKKKKKSKKLFHTLNTHVCCFTMTLLLLLSTYTMCISIRCIHLLLSLALFGLRIN